MGTIKVEERTLAELIITKENYEEIKKEITTLYVLVTGLEQTFNQDVENELEEI